MMHRKFSAFFCPHTPCRCFGVVLKNAFFPFSALNSVSPFFCAEKTEVLDCPKFPAQVSLGSPFLLLLFC